VADEHGSDHSLVGNDAQQLVGGRGGGKRADPQCVEEVGDESDRDLYQRRLPRTAGCGLDSLRRRRAPPSDDEDDGKKDKTDEQRCSDNQTGPTSSSVSARALLGDSCVDRVERL
jgi:hypothetical protein